MRAGLQPLVLACLDLRPHLRAELLWPPGPASWAGLPAPVRRQVEQHTGPVLAAAGHGEGQGSDLRAVLRTQHSEVFVKGLPTGDPRAWSLHTEAALSL